MIIIIDNYDSFTYNLVQQIGAFGERMEVYRNDKVCIEEIEEKIPDHIIISPGPCTPKEAGISNDIIKNFSGKIPILGGCLGFHGDGQPGNGRIGLWGSPTSCG